MLKLDLHIIELEKENYHIMVEGEFADGEKCMWIIDTGASKSVLDKNLDMYYNIVETEDPGEFQSAGINEGMIETQVGVASTFNLGSLEINDLKVALIDLSHVNDIYSKYSEYKIAGLIGGDILYKHHAIIDYQEQRLFLFED